MIDQTVIKEFSRFLKATGKQAATIDSYQRDASALLRYLNIYNLPLEALSSDIFQDFKAHLDQELHEKPNTIRRMIIGARQFYRFLEKTEYVKTSPLEVVAIPKRLDVGFDLISPRQLDRMLSFNNANQHHIINSRNRAIISLLAGEGLKATELIDLKWSHLSTRKKAAGDTYLKIPGARSRTIRITVDSSQAIFAYQKVYNEFHRENRGKFENTFMFIGFQGRGTSHIQKQLTRHGLKFLLYEIGAAANIEKLNCERLRHYAIHNLVSNGQSTEDIMKHLGLRQPGIIIQHQLHKDHEHVN